MQTEFIDLMSQFKRGSPFSETDAIMDILAMADENGEFYSTIRQLMDRWKWGNTKVSSFLRQLEKQDIIKTQTRHKQDTLYRINTGLLHNVQDTNKTQAKEKKPQEDTEIYKRIISYLNEKCHTWYSPENEDTRERIDKILNMGYKEKDFYSVIDIKVSEWYGTKWGKYLRPYTLFGDKFENYINQAKREAKAESGIEVVEDEEEILTDLDDYTQY